MDEVKQEELRKLAEEILSGGKQAVEGFNFDTYTEEELHFIEREIDKQISRELDEFIQTLDAGK